MKYITDFGNLNAFSEALLIDSRLRREFWRTALECAIPFKRLISFVPLAAEDLKDSSGPEQCDVSAFKPFLYL